MLYRRFGKTELQLPVITFGCMRSMHSWSDAPLIAIPQASTDTLEELAVTALAHGINHFETAHGYGSSERQLGAVLQRLNRHDLVVQTKVVPHADPRVFVNKVEESLARLQLDHVDLLALHGINDYRSLWASLRPGGCLAAARELQRRGKIGHVGFSGHGPPEVIMAAINHDDDGGFDYVNLHWYYIYDVNRPAIGLAAERDLGVYIISPTDKGGMLYHPPAILAESCQPLSPIVFNDLYCLGEPGVTAIGVGAARISDFAAHLQAADRLPHQDPAHIQAIADRLEQQMKASTGFTRPDASWFGLPEWEITPGYINLRFISWLWRLARGWGLETFSAARYAMLGKGDSWVQGNHAGGLDLHDWSETIRHYPAVDEEFIEEVREAHRVLTGNSR